MVIYISSRPTYSPRLTRDVDERISRLSLHSDAPFRIGLPSLSTLWHQHGILLEEVSRVARGWDGSSPVSLRFDRYYMDLVITLGRCTYNQAMSPRDATDSLEVVLGPHFIAVQMGFKLIQQGPSHDCKRDHVEAGTTCLWKLADNILAWYGPEDLQISLTRSHFDSGSGKMLEVHLNTVQRTEGV